MAPMHTSVSEGVAKGKRSSTRLRAQQPGQDHTMAKSDDSDLDASDSSLETSGSDGANEEGGEHGESDDDDEAEDEEEEGDESEDEDLVPVVASAPLLPQHLLKPMPSPAHSAQNAPAMQWSEMSSKQKHVQRTRSRQYKKRVYDSLRKHTEGTGVLKAGKMAQIKRGVAPAVGKVKTGRVEKSKGGIAQSGRQKLLQQRKEAVRRVPRER